MKTNAIIRIVLFSVVGLILVSLLVAFLIGDALTLPSEQAQPGISGTESVQPSEASTQGQLPEQNDGLSTYRLDASAVRELEINWVSGSITIEPGQTDQVIFSEPANAKKPMVWRQEGDKLVILFSDSERDWNDIKLRNYHKDLKITVPANWMGEEIDINTASARVNLSDLTVEDVDINCVSGICDLRGCTLEDLTVQTVSGNVTFEGSLQSLECDAVSADCTAILSRNPDEVTLYSVSGALNLTLPADSGFYLKMPNARGKLNTDFDVTQDGSEFFCGDGSSDITVGGVSSRVTIRKAENR